MNTQHSHVKRLLKLAKEVALEYGLGYVGTEHLLLAIVREGSSFAAEILRTHGANEYVVQRVVDELVQTRTQETWVAGRCPGTPHFRDVVDKAASHARGCGNWEVTPEHLLLGLLAEQKSLGYQALERLGVSVGDVQKAMRSLRDGRPAAP
jgi:ATP-dependent Clp protease ATP-binding subunit ClpC